LGFVYCNNLGIEMLRETDAESIFLPVGVDDYDLLFKAVQILNETAGKVLFNFKF